MPCQYCGQPIPDNSAVCPSCGAPVAVAQPNPYGQSYQAPPPGADAPPSYAGYPGYPPMGGYPPAQVPLYQPMPGYEQKSKLAAGLLGIFLGGFGVGRFYLGYTNLGVAQLLVSVFTLGIGGLWGFIDGIMILTGSVQVDGKGVPLRD